MNERLYTLTRVPVAVYPIIATMAVAVGFAGWFVGRLAHHPDVSWTNKNPRPYLHVKQNETIKFMNPNKRFERNWVRQNL